MKPILYSALAVAITLVFSSSSAMAQNYNQSYQFGVGLNYGNNFGEKNFRRFGPLLSPRGISRRVEQPPYFAKFPPVYYNGIVSRPYGISPYAAPPGIAPVEMSVIQPITVTNPFFEKKSETVASEKSEPAKTTDNKTTAIWVDNPFAKGEVSLAWIQNPYASGEMSIAGR